MSRATDLFFEHSKGLSQFAYFQLGIAASAIAFTVHQTRDMSLSEAPWPLGVAVVLWALSFVFGCAGLQARTDGIGQNAKILFLSERIHPTLRNDLEVAEAYREWSADVDDAMAKPHARFRLQVWSVFVGAIAYISGHIMLMAGN